MPRPCAAETATGSPSPRPWKSCASSRSLRRVDLVGGDDDRQVAAAQDVGDLLVARAQAGAGVDHEQRDLRVGQRGARLVLDRDRQRIVVVEVHAAGVDQREAAPVPVGRELLAVARDPGALVHDRLAALREAVDERRLADVRIADDRDLHASTSLASTASVTIWSTTSSSVSPVVSTGTASCGGLERRAAGRRVAHVALALARRAPLDVRPRSARAAARALGGSAVQEDLDGGVGRDDACAMSRPSATQSPAATIACCLRTSAARTAGSAATLRRGLGGRRRADLLGHVAAVEQHALADLDRDPLGDLAGGRVGRRARPARRSDTSPRCPGTCSPAAPRQRARQWTFRPRRDRRWR